MRDYSEDFEGWCRDCVKIADKESGALVPLHLNAPQRRVASVMEAERRAGRPIRILLLKARQWGGSTLVEAYMAWMQLVRHRSWSAVICAHTKDAAAVLRGIYSSILHYYPATMRGGEDAKAWQFSPYEKTQNILYLPARDCRLGISTVNRPDALRGSAYMMAHLSEAAFWADGDTDAASAIIRTVSSTIPMVKDSLIVIESTANGKENYLYKEWQRVMTGESDKIGVFVPWYEIELYRREINAEEREGILGSLSKYEEELLHLGANVENLAWYRLKRKEYHSREEMMSEFPSTAEEAFATTERSVFGAEERPERGPVEGVKLRLVVALPDAEGESHLLGKFGRVGSTIVNLGDESHSTLEGLMHRCGELCRRSSAQLAIGNMRGDEGVSHGRWCTRRGKVMQISMAYDEDERSMIDITGEEVSDMCDIHSEHLRRRGVIDNAEGIYEEYKRFRIRGYQRWPRLILRILGSHYMDIQIGEKELKAEEFY